MGICYEACVRVRILVRVHYGYADMTRPKKIGYGYNWDTSINFLFFIIYSLRFNLQIKLQYQN